MEGILLVGFRDPMFADSGVLPRNKLGSPSGGHCCS